MDRDILDEFDQSLSGLILGTANELVNSRQAEKVVTMVGMLELAKGNLIAGVNKMIDDMDKEGL
jgi:hypothetical protein